MSAKIESGMVRLKARVPIKDDVRKHPLKTNKQPYHENIEHFFITNTNSKLLNKKG